VSVSCPRCDRPLELEGLVSGPQACPLCHGRFEAVRFDPPEPDTRVRRLAESGPEAASPCPLHPGNAARAHCARCGVFTCDRCRVELSDRVVCPACFERLADELPELVVSYRDYARLQQLVLLLGLFVLPVGPVAGPASIYCGVKALAQRRRAGDVGTPPGVWLSFLLGAAVSVGGVAALVWIFR
jgi:hypothetical protein